MLLETRQAPCGHFLFVHKPRAPGSMKQSPQKKNELVRASTEPWEPLGDQRTVLPPTPMSQVGRLAQPTVCGCCLGEVQQQSRAERRSHVGSSGHAKGTLGLSAKSPGF